jgi:hypothetical protein
MIVIRRVSDASSSRLSLGTFGNGKKLLFARSCTVHHETEADTRHYTLSEPSDWRLAQCHRICYSLQWTRSKATAIPVWSAGAINLQQCETALSLKAIHLIFLSKAIPQTQPYERDQVARFHLPQRSSNMAKRTSRYGSEVDWPI